ncbi:uncharacterized protein LOC115696726 [Cannabis sativa]|uniref:uncharacterized protein LOC115696726 n=1 Tax=Cannabis sativa TaxID=3483 RepID=UPI0011DFBEAB|nr:uncharacterized protein LOC115696726 [Cannabis sativa]
MARKRKTVSKSAEVVFGIKDPSPELLLIQEEHLVADTETFHDPCDLLETEVLDLGDGEGTSLSSKPVSWAEEAKRWTFSRQPRTFGANSTLIKFREKNLGKLGIETIVRMHSGFTLVSFRDEETRNIILETGVVHFDSKHVVLRPWLTDMDAANMVKSVPIWMRLNGLGLQYWDKKNLSALVSTVRRPIMVDKVTQNRSMVMYARVLVDMEIQRDPPKAIAFINEKKQLVEQAIVYEWLPSKCVSCGNLGHIVANCNKDKGVVWRKKEAPRGKNIVNQ